MDSLSNWVLIVEDEADLRDGLTDLLQRSGYKILGCPSLSEASKLATNQKFGCIIIDYKLERGNGDVLIKKLRNSPAHMNHETPVILISGHLDLDILQPLKTFINGALVKPFDPEALVLKVKSLCPPAGRLSETG